MINGSFFVVTLASVLFMQIVCFIYFWKRRKSPTFSCKGLVILSFYILTMTVWLLLSFSSMAIDEWRYYLSLTILLFKSIIHGNDLFDAPRMIEIILLKITFWIDLGAYVLTVIHLVISKNEDSVYPTKNKDTESNCCMCCDYRPFCNFVTLL